MNGTSVTGDLYTGDTPEKTDGGITYILGLTFAISVLLLTLSYASYKCQRNTRSSSPPLVDGHHHRRSVTGIDDDVLMTFPAFVYSEIMISKTKLAGAGESAVDGNGSGCSICLSDYKAADVIRLLPECGHLFHCKCIDTWLKVQPTCPVCRNSPLPVVKVSIQRS